MAKAINPPTPATSSAEVDIIVTPKSATVADTGYTTIISERVITDKADGKVISRENIREVVPNQDGVARVNALTKNVPTEE